MREVTCFSIKLLALVAGLPLVLPAGWCCAAPALTQARKPVTRPHCCSPTNSEMPPLPCPSSTPTKASEQCCSVDSVPAPSFKSPIVLGVASPIAAVDLPPLLAIPGLAGGPCPISSPPLHVVQCVWRC